MKRTKLILVTSGFPFGGHETFLETEIKYLCKGFDKVQIIAVDPESETLRSVPEICSVNSIYTKSGFAQKISALVGIIDPKTRAELRIIQKTYCISLNKGILSTLLLSLQRAKDIRQQILPYIEKDLKTVIYSYWCDDSALALALLSEERNEFKTVCRIHGWDVYFDRSSLGYLPYRHYIHNQLSAIYSISEDGINYTKNVWNVSGEKLKLSRLGTEAQNPFPQRTGGIFTLVSCSNLIQVKRVHLIAEAVKELDGQFPLRWVHIGDGPERSKIEQLVSNLSEKTEVRFTGRLPNEEVFKLYRELSPDVFINVSSSEGVPVSIMEAMSFGIPVIATDVGGNAEIVNGTNGFLLSSNCEKQELLGKLDFALRTSKMGSLRKGAFNTWKKDYSATVNYEQFTEMLLKL